VFRIEYDLRDAFAIPQVNKHNAAVIAPHVYPAAKVHLLADVRRP
jgi:hypothetical protein